MDYLLLAGLVWEKNTVPDWKFTIVYEQANMLSTGSCNTFFVLTKHMCNPGNTINLM